jgi:hypothetical protein
MHTANAVELTVAEGPPATSVAITPTSITRRSAGFKARRT